MSPRARAGKRWRVKLSDLRTVHKDGSGAVPKDSGAPVPSWGLEKQEKRVLTRTRDRAEWRGLPAGRSQCQPHPPVSSWRSPLDKRCQSQRARSALGAKNRMGKGRKRIRGEHGSS